MTVKRLRLAVLALSGRIFAGTANARNDGLNNRQDVTSDFMKCVIDKADYHGGVFEIEGDSELWEVTVKKLK